MWNTSSTSLGGGFLDESTQGSSTSKKGPQNEKSTFPVLIKQITSSTEDLQIAGRTVNTLKLVGIIRRIEQDTTKITYTIEDDTDTISAMMWIEANKDPVESNICTQVNTYVQIFGVLRMQSNQRFVMIVRMHPLESLDEITAHFMEVLIITVMARKPPEETMLPTNNLSVIDSTMSGMSPEQMAVLEVVRSANEAECGIEKKDILVKIPKHIIPRVNEILDFLLCEGHIYTTSSEDFFKAT